jgi:hypothetical protein
LQVVAPATNRVFLAYVSGPVLTEAAAATGTYYTYRLNSIYDPDFTGVGTTAIGYSNFSTMYGLYRVRSVRVIARFCLTTTGVATVGLIAGLNSTYGSNLFLWEAQPNTVSKLIQGNVGGARSVAEFDVTYNLPRICGLTPSQYFNETDFTHLVGSNPVKSVYLSAFMRGNSGSAQTVTPVIRLIYEVEMSQPLQALTA